MINIESDLRKSKEKFVQQSYFLKSQKLQDDFGPDENGFHAWNNKKKSLDRIDTENLKLYQKLKSR